jgi:hypothetical protein
MIVLAATDQPTWQIVLGASAMVVVIFVTMIVGAVIWSRHGLFPASRLPEGSRLRRRYEKWNRQAGWGDGVDDGPAPKGE